MDYYLMFKYIGAEKQDITSNKKTTPRRSFKLLFFD